MIGVWVVRDALSDIQAAFPTEKAAVDYTHKWVGDGLITVTRETLLTPAQAAVLEAAKAWRSAWLIATRIGSKEGVQLLESRCTALDEAVTTLRAQEGA